MLQASQSQTSTEGFTQPKRRRQTRKGDAFEMCVPVKCVIAILKASGVNLISPPAIAMYGSLAWTHDPTQGRADVCELRNGH